MQSTVTTKRIYLDWNATAPCLPEARQRVAEVLERLAGNPSSLHAEGRAARAVLEDARARVGSCIGADAAEIIFTSGGTESNHLALSAQRNGSSPDNRRRIASAIEHASLIDPLRHQASLGELVSFCGCNADGFISPDAISEAIQSETDWVSIMLVNNETGVIQPVAEITRRVHAVSAVMHTDAVQALGRLPLDVDTLGIDAMSLSAHKIGGPPGIGALYLRRGLEITPTFFGGLQENGRRAGTENVAAAAGFAVAIELAVMRQAEENQRLEALHNAFETGLRRVLDGVHLNGGGPRVPHTSNLSFDGCRGNDIAAGLDRAGVAVSVGSACHSVDRKPSHVLEAMCLTPGRCRGAVRFSFGHATTSSDLERLLQIMPGIVKNLRTKPTLQTP